MKIRNICLAFGLALVVPVAAHAQSADANYCQALSAKYQKYLANSGDPRRQAMPNVSATSAMVKCQEGDTAAGIPSLERALQDARIELPTRG